MAEADAVLASEQAPLPDIELPDIPAYREIPAVRIGLSSASAIRIEVEDHSSLSLGRDEHGHSSLHLAAARVLESVTNIVDNRTASEAVILLSEKAPVEGWTSLHISTLKNDAAIVHYILGKVSDDQQRRQFINEVDRKLGWSSLQWGAALDRANAVQATMNHMSLDHQKEVMSGSSWTLLHATAKSGAVRTMESLMERVELNSEEKWRILTCPTSDGKTALHIAVAEGKARAAIMLLDLAGNSQSVLSSQKDSSGMKAQDYSGQFPLLGEYLSLAEVMFEEPIIHKAARREDWYLVSWILDQYPQQELEKISQRSQDGSTVLHVCSEANSPLVIKEIARRLNPEEFMSSIKELDNDGQSAIHLSASKSSPASAHAILSLLSKENRSDLLMLNNRSGESASQVAEKLKYQDVVNIIQYHHLILAAEGLERFFYEFEYSLFSLEIPDDRLKIRYKRLEQRMEDDRGLMRHVNLDATVCILHGNMERAEVLIAAAVKVDDENMHTWCNQGILKLHKERPEEAETAAFRVLELMAEGSVACQLRPKIDFAYWMAEVLRTEEARDECCKIMQDCQAQASKDIKMQEFLSYCFVKILIRHLRSDDKHGKTSQWYKEKLDRAVEQLVILSKSNNPQYRADMWLWLAELQYINIPPDYLIGPLQTFRTETEIVAVDRESCFNTVMDMDADEKINLERKVRARIARNCLDIAYHCKGEKRKWFTKAVDMSYKWMEDNHWVLMCSSTCAQGLLYLWAIEFYEEHGDLVREQYKRLKWKEMIDSPNVAWEFLTTHFYNADIYADDKTQLRLGEVKQHLAKITDDTSDGWVSFGVKYARIKFLVGDSWQEVEGAFKRAISYSDTTVRYIKALEHFGCYYLAIRNYEHAFTQFTEAIRESKINTIDYRAPIAQGGIRFIDYMSNCVRRPQQRRWV